jgi:hypothetical protein
VGLLPWIPRHIQEVWIVVFGERKGGRAAAVGVLLGLTLLAATVAWYPTGQQDAGPPETSAQAAAVQVGSTAGVLGPSARAGWRKASPITRGQDLGLRFRPDERAPAYGGVIGPGGGQVEPREQANFRPVAPRKKPTYEELQAREQASVPRRPMPSAAPYPGLPPYLPPRLPPPYPGAPW